MNPHSSPNFAYMLLSIVFLKYAIFIISYEELDLRVETIIFLPASLSEDKTEQIG